MTSANEPAPVLPYARGRVAVAPAHVLVGLAIWAALGLPLWFALDLLRRFLDDAQVFCGSKLTMLGDHIFVALQHDGWIALAVAGGLAGSAVWFTRRRTMSGLVLAGFLAAWFLVILVLATAWISTYAFEITRPIRVSP